VLHRSVTFAARGRRWRSQIRGAVLLRGYGPGVRLGVRLPAASASLGELSPQLSLALGP